MSSQDRGFGDFSHSISQALQHQSGGTGGGENESFFNQAASFISQHKDQILDEDIDENKAVHAHETLYGSESGEGGSQARKHDADFLGEGAAMQAFKMFSSGNHAEGGGGLPGVGGQDGNKLVGLAMAQAGKLFDHHNASGNVVCFNIPFFPVFPVQPPDLLICL